MKSPEIRPYRSPDYASHGQILGPLTDRKISRYALQGKYGKAMQEREEARVAKLKTSRRKAKLTKAEKEAYDLVASMGLEDFILNLVNS